MKEYLVAFLLSSSPLIAVAGTITSNLTMVDGYFTAKISAPDDEDIWLGNVDFNYLGGVPLHCENVAMGTGGEEGKKFTSATYECQNQFKVVLKKQESEKTADFTLYYQNEEKISYKMVSDPMLSQYVASDYLSKKQHENTAAREKYLSENTFSIMQACLGMLEANHYAAIAALQPGAGKSRMASRVSSSIEPLYGEDAKSYAEQLISYYSSNKDEALLESRNNGNLVFTAQLCTQQPDKFIPEIGKLLWSGKVRK